MAITANRLEVDLQAPWEPAPERPPPRWIWFLPPRQLRRITSPIPRHLTLPVAPGWPLCWATAANTLR
jgi:hypothetical protein